jgi:hypothetical protein
LLSAADFEKRILNFKNIKMRKSNYPPKEKDTLSTFEAICGLLLALVIAIIMLRIGGVI